MQVFKAFFKIANKNKLQCFIYLGVFLVLIMLMSASGQKTAATQFKAQSIDLCIVDHDNSKLSEAITDYLSDHHTIVEIENPTNEVLTDKLFYQSISYALIIPEGFEDAFLSNDDSVTLEHSMRKDSAAGFFVNHQLDGYLDSIRLYRAGGFDLDEAITRSLASLSKNPEVTSISFEDTNSSSHDLMFYFFQYYCYVVLMIITIGLVPILTTFRKKDVAARINCSSISDRSKNLQIALGCIVYSLLVWFVFIILSLIFLQPSAVLSEIGLLCIGNSFVYTMIVTAITLLFASLNLTDNALNLAANIVGLGSSFLCGVFVPQWFLADSVLAVGKFLPAYWYVKVINMVSGWSGEAYSITAFWKYVGVQFIFFLVIMSVYLVCNKQKRLSS